MTITINISSDIDKALGETKRFFERQVPFAISGAIVDSAFDIRRRVVGSTYPQAFEVRNKSAPRVMFNILDETGKPFKTKGGISRLSRKLKTQGTTVLSVGDAKGHINSKLHAGSGTRAAQAGTLAVPTDGNSLRGASGVVFKRNKPLNITNRKKFFLLKKGGRKRAIVERKGKTTTAVYLFMNSAPIKKRFRFYEDAMDTSLRVFPGHLDRRLARAIQTSRFVAI